MNVKEYISSGIIESYVLGLASEAERMEFETNCVQYPEIKEARDDFERTLEEQMLADAPAAPKFLKQQIEEKLKSVSSETTTAEVKEEKTPVRSMGIWRWVAAASLILLAGSIYWALTTNKKYQELQAKNKQLEDHVQQYTAQLDSFKQDAEILQHPGMKMAELKGTASAPQPMATVYWDTTATKDVYLLINNLPQPASDKQYQLWALLNGEPIDLGMIEVRQKRLLYRMKNVQNAEAFAITLEPKGGSEKPTTPPIAVSRL